jgi:regulator of RNase E activity RraA
MNCAEKKIVADSTNVVVSESIRYAKKEVASERELLEKAITRRLERECISSDLTLEEKKER